MRCAVFQVECPWDLAYDSGQRSWHIPISITAHPRGAFISVGDLTPAKTNKPGVNMCQAL